MPHLLFGCLTILTSSFSGHVPLWSYPDCAWFIVALLVTTLPCWLVSFSSFPASTTSQFPFPVPLPKKGSHGITLDSWDQTLMLVLSCFLTPAKLQEKFLHSM